MPILRKLMVTALTLGAVIGAPSAALASAAPAAHQAGAAVAKIHQVPCRSWTFNVYHGRETCYEGTGRIRPDIRNVRIITTGENSGYFWLRTSHGITIIKFRPNEHITISGHPELTVLDITST